MITAKTEYLFEFILYCSDQQKSRDFYSKVLDLQPSLDVPGMTEFNLSPELKLGLMPENGIARILGNKTPHPSSSNGIPRCELYIKTKDIQTDFDRAVSAGAEVIDQVYQRDWGDAVGYLADPDGHIIAFAETVNEKVQNV